MAPKSSKKSKTGKKSGRGEASKAKDNSTATNGATANSNPAPNDNSNTSDNPDTSNNAAVPATSAAPIDRPKTWNELLNWPEIQEAVIREGQLDRPDIDRPDIDRPDIDALRIAGMNINLSETVHRVYRGGEETRCHVKAPDDQCPNTSITYDGRIQPCDGARQHNGFVLGLTNRHTNIYTLAPMGPLVRLPDPLRQAQLPPPPPFENQNGVHPPWTGPPFQVCQRCHQSGCNHARIRHKKRSWRARWVPYCIKHSDSIARNWGNGQAQHNGVGPVSCRCENDVEDGWVCADHRNMTALSIELSAKEQIDWMRQVHFIGVRQHDPQRPMKKWPGCPHHIDCGEKLWRTTRIRFAKCLGCGGLVRCRGKIGNLHLVE